MILRGIKAVSAALELEDFPATKQDLYYSVGDIEIEDLNGRYLPVRKVLDQVSQNEFATVEDAIEALKKQLSVRSAA
jgi:hypothetical protein